MRETPTIEKYTHLVNLFATLRDESTIQMREHDEHIVLSYPRRYGRSSDIARVDRDLLKATFDESKADKRTLKGWLRLYDRTVPAGTIAEDVASRRKEIARLLAEQEAARRAIPPRERFLTTVRSRLDGRRGVIERFATDLVNKPSFMFEQSEFAFEAAADVELLSELERALTDEENVITLAELRNDVQKAVTRMARNLSRSSSPAFNLMNQYRLSFWANLLDDFEFIRLVMEENGDA